MRNLFHLHTLTSVLLSLLSINGLLDTSAFKYNHNYDAEFVEDGWRDLSNEDLVDEGPNEFIEPVDYWPRSKLQSSQNTQYQDLPRLRPRQFNFWKNRDNDLDYASSSKPWIQTEHYSVYQRLAKKTPSLLQQTSVKVSIASSNGPIGYNSYKDQQRLYQKYISSFRYGFTSGRDDIFRHRRYPNLLSRFNDPGVPCWSNSFPNNRFSFKKKIRFVKVLPKVENDSRIANVPSRVDKNSSIANVPSRVDKNSGIVEFAFRNTENNPPAPIMNLDDPPAPIMNLDASASVPNIANETAINKIANDVQDSTTKTYKRQFLAKIILSVVCALDLILLVRVCRKKCIDKERENNKRILREIDLENDRFLRESGGSHSIVIPGLVAYGRRKNQIIKNYFRFSESYFSERLQS